jgi:hypothetical protein
MIDNKHLVDLVYRPEANEWTLQAMMEKPELDQLIQDNAGICSLFCNEYCGYRITHTKTVISEIAAISIIALLANSFLSVPLQAS